MNQSEMIDSECWQSTTLFSFFFKSIAQYSNYKEYKDEYLKANDDDIIDDLLNQIYQNSIISNKKYISFTNGVRYFLLGFVSLLIIYGLGLLIYL